MVARGDILNGTNAGETFRTDHGRWFFQLFEPFVAAGAYGPSGLGGYRNQPVYLQGSRHVPPRWEIVPDAMDALFALLEEEPHPAVRAVAGHWLRHAPSWQLALPCGRAGSVVRALAWLGPTEVEDGLNSVVPMLSEAERNQLAGVRSILPKWMAEPLGARLAHG